MEIDYTYDKLLWGVLTNSEHDFTVEHRPNGSAADAWSEPLRVSGLGFGENGNGCRRARHDVWCPQAPCPHESYNSLPSAAGSACTTPVALAFAAPFTARHVRLSNFTNL